MGTGGCQGRDVEWARMGLGCGQALGTCRTVRISGRDKKGVEKVCVGLGKPV